MHTKLTTFQFIKYKLLLFAVKEMMFIASYIWELISRYLFLFLLIPVYVWMCVWVCFFKS